jgi:hypothetical protein
MTICSHCGQELRADDRYCQFCGHELSQDLSALAGAEPAPMRAGSSGDGVRWQQNPPASFPPKYEANAYNHGELSSSSAPVATALAQARLIVRSAAEGGDGDNRAEREFLLGERDIAVGRAPSCDIVLTGDQLASRRHALLRNKGRHYTVVDLGSSNGTYVNDLEIHEETVLHDGDCVKVGGHELLYSTGPASPEASLAEAHISEPLPHTPLSETNPSVPSINFPEFAQEASAPASQDLPQEEAPPAPAPVERSYAPTSNLQAMREQLAQLSAALAESADEAAREADRLRGGLIEFREQLTALLDGPQVGAARGQDSAVVALIEIARQAAEDRRLDHVSALAEHASQIADALEASRPAGDGWLTRGALTELRKRVDELLSQDDGE